MNLLRHGRHHRNLVYVQHGDEPADTDRLFAVCFNEQDAEVIVGWSTFLKDVLDKPEAPEVTG